MTNERDPVTIEPATGDENTEPAGPNAEAKADPQPAPRADPKADPKAAEETESKSDDKTEDTPSGAWKAFAPAPAMPAGRFQRWTGRLGRVIGHEWTVVGILS